MSAAATPAGFIDRCDQGPVIAHVRRFSRAHRVLSLSAAGPTAAVGVTVLYDALPDAWKAGQHWRPSWRSSRSPGCPPRTGWRGGRCNERPG